MCMHSTLHDTFFKDSQEIHKNGKMLAVVIPGTYLQVIFSLLFCSLLHFSDDITFTIREKTYKNNLACDTC